MFGAIGGEGNIYYTLTKGLDKNLFILGVISVRYIRYVYLRFKR